MKFASTRLIAADIKPLVHFFKNGSGTEGRKSLAPVFAEIVTPAATLALALPKP